MTLLAMCTNIFAFSQLEKKSVAVGLPSTSQHQKGIREGQEDVWINDYAVQTETVKDEEWMCREKSASKPSKFE
jgi:hypothetical protein